MTVQEGGSVTTGIAPDGMAADDMAPGEMAAGEMAPGEMAPLADPDRLKALHRSRLLDSGPEDTFDRAVELATDVLGTPVSLLSLVDGERQFFKAQRGLTGWAATDRGTPLSHSFCRHVVATDDVLRIADARTDERVKGNGAIGDLGVISYLGVPVHAPGGEVLGSLCAIGPEPRDWSERDARCLANIARGVESEIALRAMARDRADERIRFRTIVDELPLGVAVADVPSAALVTMNRWGERVLSEPVEADGPRDYRTMGAQHPNGARYRGEEYPLVRAAVAGETIRNEPMLYRRADGTLAELEVSAQRVGGDGSGGEPFAIATFVDVTDRKRAEGSAEQARSQLVRVLEATTDPILVMDRDWRITYGNHAARSMLADGHDIVGRDVWDAFPRWAEGPLWHAYQDAMRSGAPGKADLHLAGKDGRTGKEFEARAFPSERDLTVFFRDVTAEREAAETRQLLVRELNHRVKNLFAVVSGMIGMTARHTRTPAAMAQALRGRIASLARAHELIRPAVTQEDIGQPDVSMQHLIASLIEPHVVHQSDRVSIEGPMLTLGANGATSLALALHELATNAAKYGSLSVPDGELAVSWTNEADRVRLRWVETGGPPIAEAPERNGFGSTLIDMSVRSQLQGSITTEWRTEGLAVAIAASIVRLKA